MSDLLCTVAKVNRFEIVTPSLHEIDVSGELVIEFTTVDTSIRGSARLLGKCLDQLFGMPLKSLAKFCFPNRNIVDALQAMLVGQCVLLTVDSALTLQSHQSQPLIARAIQILGDDCQTILSHLPFTTAASSTAHFHQTPKSSSTSLNDSTVTPIPLLMSPSPEHCNTNSPLPPPEHQSAHHSTPCITSSENTPELFSQCEEQDFSFSKQSSSSTTPLLRHFTQHPPRNLLLTPELFESHD